jgi:PTS system nitrogen regulatory IIA component
MKEQNGEHSLAALIERGGVCYDIPGASPREALAGIVAAAALPPWVNREALLEAALEREALMSTAVGRGIALPHPRNPLVTRPEEQLVCVAFLREPANWNALDGEGVHTAILIVSASAKLHLHTLSRVNFFCQQEPFYGLLKSRAPAGEIIRFIKDVERTWGGQ